MMTLGKTAMAGLVALSLAACASDSGPKETIGTLLGAGLGGLAGSQIGSGSGQLAAVAGGTLLGAFLGKEIGSSLDNADEAAANQAAQQSLETSPTGSTSTWSNPDSGNSGTFTPTKTYQTASDQYCREYQQTVTVNGETQTAYGTACRQPDGSWKVVN